MQQSNFGFGSNEKDIKNILDRYETMVSEGDITFFDQFEYEQLISHFERQSELNTAISICDQALTQHSYSSTFYIRKAQLLIELDCPEDALTVLNEGANFDASELEIFLTKADALSISGRYEEAMEVLRSAYKVSSESDLSDILLAKSSLLEDQEKFAEAFYVLKRIILKYPNNKEAKNRICFLVELADKYEESIEIYEGILDNDPYSSETWYNLGTAYFELEKYKQSSEAYEYAFITDPTFEMAYFDAAETYTLTQDFHKALSIYHEAIATFGEQASTYISMGSCYIMQNDPFNAKEYILKGLALDPNYAEAYYLLGKCHAAESDWPQALACFLKALNIDEMNVDYYTSVGEAHFQLDNDELAISYFTKANELAPSDATGWVHHISSLLHLGNIPAAYNVVCAAKKEISSTEVDYMEFVTLLKLGYREEALHIFSVALESNYNQHKPILDLFPELKEDLEVVEILHGFNK